MNARRQLNPPSLSRISLLSRLSLASPPACLSRRPWLWAAPLIALPFHVQASGNGEAATTLFWVAILLIIAKLSSLVEKVGQPAVLGELVAGVLLGNLALVGIGVFEPLRSDPMLHFLSELGVVMLLFQIGLESDIKTMRSVGARALAVAVMGVAVPFALGTLVVGPLLFPGASQNTYLFFGATLTATSVGITARVFKDIGVLQSRESQIVLGAAVIDDVIGLIILAIVSAIVTTGNVSVTNVALITGKSVLFLGGAVVIGLWAAPLISRGFARINTGVGMKFTIAIAFCFIFAYLAQQVGLAPIVGAFAAGLVLEDVTFKDFDQLEMVPDIRQALMDAPEQARRDVEAVIDHHSRHHLQYLTMPLGNLLVPLFFVYTGMQVDLTTLFDRHALLVALAVTGLAFAGKLVSGLVAGPVNKWVVGWGMAPRGEVGLIFAVVGKQLGVVNDEQFSVIVIMVMLTTLLTPVILAHLLKKARLTA